MTVHWQTLPQSMRPPRPARKPTPFHADMAAINEVFQAAGLATRARFRDGAGRKLVHWMGTPAQGQIVIYVLDRPPGEKIGKIAGLLDELAESLSKARGRECLPRLRLLPAALEVPHWRPAPLPWADPVDLQPGSARLGRAFGVRGESDVVADFDQWPHLLISGRTGAGKSILLNGLLGSLCLATPPADLRLWLVDPKNRELMALAGLPHVERAVYRPEDADQVLRWFSAEIDRRIQAGRTVGPRHVLVIDELASFMDQLSTIEDILRRAGMMGRGLGINIVAATQRPDAAAIGGSFRAQFAARISGSMASVDDARMATGVKASGAERLPVRSGRFVMSADGDLVDFQGYFVDRPAALVRAVRSRWAGAELPRPVGDDGGPVQPAGPDYGDDEIGRVALAIADLVPGYRADEVSMSELIRVAWGAGALESRTPHKGPSNRAKIDAALVRLGVGDAA